MTVVIITAPHAACPVGVINHPCDTLAKPAAELLFNALKSLSSTAYLHIGTVPRIIADLNRRSGASQRWSKIFVGRMKVQTEPFYVVDMHSYNPRQVYDREGWETAAFALMDAAPVSTALSQTVRSALESINVGNVVETPASQDNYIIVKAKSMPNCAGAILIECNEDLNTLQLTRSMNALAANLK